MKKCVLVVVSVIGFSNYASATDWYVDGKNGSDSNPGTYSLPFLTVWHGINATQPGDTLHLLPTAVYAPFGTFGKTGSPTAPITIKGDGKWPFLTKVRATGNAFGIQVNVGTNNAPSSYINIENFDVQALGPWTGIFVGVGCHHVLIQGNSVHGSGIAGINTDMSDYVTISHNFVYGNSNYTQTGVYGSGISILASADIDSNTGIKMIVAGNNVYNNRNMPQPGKTDSDGSGIIIDDSRHTHTNNIAYNGHTLIENNIVYNNGGRGIYSYESDHAIIVNNTLYENNTDPYEANWKPGEIGLNHSGDAEIYNNISYSTGVSAPADGNAIDISVDYGSGGPVIIDYNLSYNLGGQSLQYYLGDDVHHNTNLVTVGSNDLWGNPLFRNAQNHNFLLQSGSPGLGTALTSMAPKVDILGHPRPANGPTEMAVYQQAQQ
jgi:parallel beta-helix repeat protein